MVWDLDPTLFEIGPLEIRWYGLFFMIGLMLAVWTLDKTLVDRGYPKEHASTLSWVLPVGLVIGAHLVHLIFYEPESFIENPRRILELGKGLASHGGGLGTVLALYLFCRKKKVPFLEYADATMVGAAWIIAFVRVGNFFNSEIYGRVTDVPWGVVFARHGFTEPRHPSQIYEAIGGFILTGIVFWAHKHRDRFKPGQIFAGGLFLYFTFRFFVEYVKEYQTVSPSFPLTMGQMLSIPLIVLFLWLYVFTKRRDVPYPSLAAAGAAAAGSGDAAAEEDAAAGGEGDAPKAGGPKGKGKGKAKGKKR